MHENNNITSVIKAYDPRSCFASDHNAFYQFE